MIGREDVLSAGQFLTNTCSLPSSTSTGLIRLLFVTRTSTTSFLIRADFWWKGMRRSTFQWKKGVFSEEGGGNSVNRGFGKDFYRKGNSVKRFGPFTEPPDSENWKVAGAEWKCSPFFSAKGNVKFGAQFSACYVFQGLGAEPSPKCTPIMARRTEKFTQISLCWGIALKILAGKDHITWWIHLADGCPKLTAPAPNFTNFGETSWQLLFQ